MHIDVIDDISIYYDGCEGCCVGSWPASGIHIHRTMMGMAVIYRLHEEDITGACLSGKSAEDFKRGAAEMVAGMSRCS